MRALTTHLKVLISLLVIVGLGSIVYQIFFLHIPLTETEQGSLWTIDAKVSFYVRGNKPVRVKLLVPSDVNSNIYYIKSNEITLAKGYGDSIEDDQYGNRVLTWSIRRTSGLQTLYYRLALAARENAAATDKTKPGSTYMESIPLDGPEKIAADALIERIRQTSSDTQTFITAAIKAINNTKDSNVAALLNNNKTVKNKVQILEILLSQAHIPIQQVHTIRLIRDTNQKPELWVRSYIANSASKPGAKATGKWVYFNPETGKMGLPDDRIIWWVGSTELLSVENGTQAQVTFSLDDRTLTAKTIISKMSTQDEVSSFLDYSLYTLPIDVQKNFNVMIMIPCGVLIILILRNIIGLQTLGTFTPVLIALAFRDTGLVKGLCLFTLIVALGLSIRSYLEHLKLQMLPRLSVVLTCVVIMIAIMSVLTHKLHLDQGLSITLFPMVILTMTIERISVTWEERGPATAMKIAVGTFMAAALAFLVMGIPELVYFVFTFPGILLVLIGFMLAMGRYRGYRLTELRRFRALLKEG